MNDMNRVNVIGRLTRDPELKATAGGFSITKFGLAVNKSLKKGDVYEDKACFFDCVVFGKRAETASKYLTKGQRVGIDGALDFESWADKDGHRRSKVQIVVENFYFLDSKKDAQSEPTTYSNFDDEDIPM